MQGRYANCVDTEFQVLEALARGDVLRAKNDFAILTATADRVKKALEEAGCFSIKDLTPALSRGAILASSKQAEGDYSD
ncbi:hypothetical protein HYQ46_002435 [Verticillium longisporum]|nr:hypothetical protein HYQ46_002435 [Verticillium longisporum]